MSKDNDKKGVHKNVIATNKRAFFDYHIHEKLECGIVLVGCEVKSIRSGHINIKESFGRIIKNELWIFNAHINPYPQGNRFNPEPTRDRKLLIHRAELNRLIGKVERKGHTLVPLEVYILRGKVKISIGLAEAKKKYDKRASIKEKDLKREMDRAVRQ